MENQSQPCFISSFSCKESEFEDVRSLQSRDVAQLLSVFRSKVKHISICHVGCICVKVYEVILPLFEDVLKSTKPKLLLTFWKYSESPNNSEMSWFI